MENSHKMRMDYIQNMNLNDRKAFLRDTNYLLNYERWKEIWKEKIKKGCNRMSRKIEDSIIFLIGATRNKKEIT